jgi:methyl-accepting chemotaxis protein
MQKLFKTSPSPIEETPQNNQAEVILNYSKLMNEASGFIKEIEKGNLQVKISNTLAENELGVSLVSMQQHLANIAAEEEARTWMNAGLAKFSDILRNKESLDLQELANNILMNLVKYINANQGALFILEDNIKGDEHLHIIACYAYDRKKYINKRIEIGQGLAGQCVLEKEIIYLTEVPGDYIDITSGLGGSKPKAVLISPLLINEKVFGVVELASFEEFGRHKIDFINRLSENIASSIKNVKDNERTLFLLNASQQQAEELRAQEEEMRQNMEEMQATQEEMVRKNEEIAMAGAESQGILKGINATMATIEFTPEGIVVNANDNFLTVMKYTKDQIKGKHHRNFVPNEMQDTEDYKTFWPRLASGVSISGIFRRLDSHGGTVWLNAIYNPIVDMNGKVTKVVKFATNITAEQEMLAENQGILNGINITMATIEFTPTGIVLGANDNFLKTMNYSLADIKGKPHRIFVSKDISDTEEYKTFWINLASGIPVAGVFERIDSHGEKVWLNAIYNPIVNASGNVIKVIKFAIDITTEKKNEAEVKQLLEEAQAQEEEIRQNLEEMQAMKENTENILEERTLELKVREDVFGLTSILSEADVYGNIIYANTKLADISQYSQKEMIGKPHNIFRHPDMPKELFKIFWETLKNGEVFRGIIKNKAKDGSHYWVDGCFVPIKDKNGKLLKYIGARYHITNDREATRMYNEQALRLGLPKLN